MTKEELDALIAEGVKRGLESFGDGGSTRVLRRVTERKVEVRMIDGKVVLGYKNRGSQQRPLYIYDEPDPKDRRQMIQYVDLILEGMKEGDAPLKVQFSQFRIESDRVKCRVINVEEKEWIINQGIVKKKEVEEYSSIELDFDVPLDVIGRTRTFTVEIPKDYGGPRNVSVHEAYVNIA